MHTLIAIPPHAKQFICMAIILELLLLLIGFHCSSSGNKGFNDSSVGFWRIVDRLHLSLVTRKDTPWSLQSMET